MAMTRHNRRRGNSTIEFTLVGIPMIFAVISIFELSRGMWIYHSLAAAVKAGTRYAIVHGQDCALLPNTCTVTIGQIASQIQAGGPGLLATDMQVTFTDATGTSVGETLADALNDSTQWPPAAASGVGQPVTISATYPFTSAISMFWPGAGQGVHPYQTVNFPASSTEKIQF